MLWKRLLNSISLATVTPSLVIFGVPKVLAVHDNIRESVDGVGGIHLAVVLGRWGLAKQAVTAMISLHKKKVQLKL